MGTLIEAYEQISKRISELNEKVKRTESEVSRLSASFMGGTAGRIEKLAEQLEKIDEYLLKVKGFQELAQKNMDSQNVLTIEAPPGYRVNLNRLRNWAMMIDPTSANDPYAQRVYVVAKCDQCFLEKKQGEFKDRISKLKADQTVGTSYEIEELKKKLAGIRAELKEYAMGPEISGFAKQVIAENSQFWNKGAPAAFKNATAAPTAIAPGAYAAPLNFESEERKWLKNVMGDFYDENGGRVLLPVELENRAAYVMAVDCTPVKRKRLDRALQNLILAVINENPAGTRKVYVLDGTRFSASWLGSLKQLEGSYVLEQIPRNPDQLTAMLEQIVSSFSDMDELLELHDSVAEYNDSAEPGKQLPMSTVIAIGWPGAFEGRDRELMQRILTNYERYGVSLVMVTYQSAGQREHMEQRAMPEYAAQNALHIRTLQNETTITFPGGTPQRFTWYTFNDILQPEYIESLLKCRTEKARIGNEYTARYPLTNLLPYTRDYKKIELPFGIDGTDQDHSVSFENENFATYLVGASRSGKSTLLHTLIAGLIWKYHPDNVELWLADFKQLEFKRYINHLPPHVKYVLLDESTELVYDLIDRLTAEMMERQKLFSRIGKQRIDQVDPTKLDKPLPVIFVVLDEFSIMSQAIAESPIYKLRLQNILAKGAALGIKFLFSSQTFTTGVAGLTATARAQIQQRIAMKGSKEEISATLELSANLKTEQVRNWMDALPPHYALVKFRTNADTLPQVKRFLVMYFENYGPRDDMIESIRASMHAVDSYQPADITSYCDKHPVLVDGNTFDAFDSKEFQKHIDMLKQNGKRDLSGDEMFVSFGTPRLMVKTRTAALSMETRENILLIARAAEQACAASVLLSTIKCYGLQGGEVQIWAYGKNRLYRAYRQGFLDSGAKIIEGIDAVCDAIRELKQALMSKTAANTLIVLIGMERICMDFEYVDVGGGAPVASESAKQTIAEIREGFQERGAIVSTEEEERTHQFAVAWVSQKSRLKREARAAGKSAEEIKEYLAEELEKFRVEFYGEAGQPGLQAAEGVETAPEQQKPAVEPETQQSENAEGQQGRAEQQGEDLEQPGTAVSGAYNAQTDFSYVMKQGSRLGYHFMMYLSNFADLKQCGLKPDLFRYKLAFQVSVDDSRALFNNKIASALPEHICQFDDTLERFSFRPYLHKGIGWEGWYVGEDGCVISPYVDSGE